MLVPNGCDEADNEDDVDFDDDDNGEADLLHVVCGLHPHMLHESGGEGAYMCIFCQRPLSHISKHLNKLATLDDSCSC